MSRYYGLMAAVTAEFHTMATQEKQGAYRMVALIFNELWHMYYNERLKLQTKTIISTLDNIQSNLLEDLIHSEPPVGQVSPPLPPPSPTEL